MAALTENSLDNGYVPSGRTRKYPVDGGSHIYRGAAVCLNANGFIVPASDTSGLLTRGVAVDEVDNSAGSDGDLDVEVDIGGAEVVVFYYGSISQANVGDLVYWEDDQTVELAGTASNDIWAGTVEGIDDQYGTSGANKIRIRVCTPGEFAAK